MAGGMAIMAITPLWSDLGTMIRTLEAGWVVNNALSEAEPDFYSDSYDCQLGRAKDLRKISRDFISHLEMILNNHELLRRARKNAFWGVRKYFNEQRLQDQWHGVLSSFVDPTQPIHSEE